MVFSSIAFLFYFLPIVLLLYYTVCRFSIRLRNIFLLAASLFFYGWGEPYYILLLIGSCVFNWAVALALSKWRNADRIWLVIGCAGNLGILFLFKYWNFVISVLDDILGFGTGLTLPLALPIGISFFTFQALSYVIDVYRRTAPVQKNLLNVTLYISFFPQLVAGPIVRYCTVEQQIHHRTHTWDLFSSGCVRFVQGLAKKLILANSFAVIADNIFSMTNAGHRFMAVPVTLAWLGSFAYTLQIFFDFSAYSDMAIGIARIFGFHLDENFRHPFLCKDITEFWQRWHISLGTFFRDYLLYVPLFGKRRKIGGLLLVWFCTGLWHGASWNYIIWGIYYGLFLMLEMGIGKKGMKKIPAVLRHLCNKIVIIVGFGIFYCTGGIDQLGDMLLAMAGQNGTGWLDTMLITSVQNNLFLLIAALLCCFPLLELPKKIMAKNPAANVALSVTGTVLAAGLLVISSILMVDATNTPFLYTKF